MPPEAGIITTGLFLWSGIIIASADAVLIGLLVWRVKPARFRALRWTLVGTAAVFWSVFSVLLVRVFWDAYYRYFYPTGFRTGGILLFVPLVYGLLALIYHTAALRLPGNPIVTFCLLGGVGSILEHAWGIYGFRILEVPVLQDASPLSILFFAVPEYIFYWCMVISLAALFQKGRRWLVAVQHSRMRHAEAK